ncbi:MAG: hypothetical protein IT370_19915 [Deltaproteobacteria bacterium]|nr:hypothetical protein [Deltaproteobacteria bacterium]
MMTTLTRIVVTAAVLAAAAPAMAQDGATTGSASASGASGSASGEWSASSGSGGGGGHLGVGAEQMSTGASGASVVWDAGKWRLGGLLAVEVQGETDLFFGARFFYRMHQQGPADLSIGAGAGVFRNGNADVTDVHVEGAIQLRAFLNQAVAVGASLGAGFVATGGDGTDDFLGLGGQLLGGAGIWYFF